MWTLLYRIAETKVSTKKERKESIICDSSRAYFGVLLGTLCGFGNLDCCLRNLKVWSTFSLSYVSYFEEIFLFFGLYFL